jgi:hypothetical protein
MSDLRRLLDGAGDDFERTLLEAATDPEAEAAQKEHTLAALGLAGPLGGGPGGGGSGGGSIAPAAKAGLGAAKWGALAAVGAAAIGAAVVLAPRARSTAPVVAPVVATASLAPSEPAPVRAPPVESSSAEPEPEGEPAATSHAAPRAPSPKPAPSAATSSDASSLKREIQALDRVRADLDRNDVAAAERELSRYDAQFPFGALAPEAERLRSRIQKKRAAPSIP